MTAKIPSSALKEVTLDDDDHAVGNNGATPHTVLAPVTVQSAGDSDADLVGPDREPKSGVSPGYRLTPEGERIAEQIASFYPEPILILGPAGTGKSLLIRHIAQQLGIDFVAVNAHQGLDISQLVGLWRPVQTESGITIEWEDGSLTRSVKTGGLFLFEEITRAPQELLSRLFGLLDTDGRYWPLPEAGIDGVEVHPDFWFVATGNPVGSGYHTASLDRALEDRFQAIYEIKEPLAPERDVLADLVGGDVAEGLDRFATDARRNESTYVSTRNLVQAARLVQRGTDPVEAVTLAISRKFRGYQDGLDELARLHLERKGRSPRPGSDLEAVFPDKQLETAVREELKKPRGPITKGDLKTLGELGANGKGIENLLGLEAAVNLTRLDLYTNQISDVTPLASLTNLTSLALGSNQISDVTPLASLTNLTDLNLYQNEISDITSLASLNKLTSLNLYHNEISDASPLASLTNLSWLRLSVNQISDITLMASLSNLIWLELHYNQISDISPLALLTNLNKLQLTHNQISDVSPLVLLTNLTELSLGDNQISDISPMASLPKLTTLQLGNNKISDISLLAQCTNLTDLGLVDNQINDVSPLASLANLSLLSLSNHQLTQESVDVHVPALKSRGVTVYP